MATGIAALQVASWDDKVVHGFCGRAGGDERSRHAGLNLSYRVADDAAAVDRNWKRFRGILPRDVRIATMRQVHGADVGVADATTVDLGEADGAISRTPGVVLTVLTADCVPILLRTRDGRAVAAIHAGWRGTAARIAAKAVAAMQRQFGVLPVDLLAAIGPSIGACCYEVGADVAAELRAAVSRSEEFYRSGAKARPMVDLGGLNREILREAGLDAASISAVGPCTQCASDEYFSYRAAGSRDTSRDTGRDPGRDTGRQVSFVGVRRA